MKWWGDDEGPADIEVFGWFALGFIIALLLVIGIWGGR